MLPKIGSEITFTSYSMNLTMSLKPDMRHLVSEMSHAVALHFSELIWKFLHIYIYTYICIYIYTHKFLFLSVYIYIDTHTFKNEIIIFKG